VNDRLMTAQAASPSLASTYELWCEEQGVHPEAPLAWETYAQMIEDLASPGLWSQAATRRAG
jgi:hypothetical protein